MARRARIEPIEWAAVYEDWRAHWLFSGQPAPGTDILDLPLVSPTHGGAIRGPVIDWWPTAAIPERKRVLEQWGTAALVMSPPWTTHQGTFHTADMLAAAATVEEGAAVWLAASLWDFLNPSQEPWHGETHALARAVYFATLAFLRERNFGLWHHRMTHALPESILSGELAEFTRPLTRRHVVALACLSVAFVRARWAIIRVIPSERPLRPVK